MADYDSNMIKPVEGLQSITGLTPAKRREKRKRRQLYNENEEKDEQQSNELVEEQQQVEPSDEWAQDQDNQNPDSAGIDYHA
jgi:hypothetical protein